NWNGPESSLFIAELYDPSGTLLTTTPIPANPVVINATASSTGTYFAHVFAPGGRVGYGLSVAVKDVTPPAVIITSPASGITNNAAPLLVFTTSDGNVTIMLDGQAINAVSGDQLGPLSDGSHRVRVEATDVVGNSGSAEVTFTVDTVTPSVMINSPVSGYTNNRTPVIAYSASDGTIVVKVDGAVVSKVSGDQLDAFADGPHTVRVEATDTAGNAGYAEVNIAVDTIAPSLLIDPVVSPTNNSSQIIMGAREADAIVAVTVNSTASVGVMQYPTPTTWSLSVSLAEGPNVFTARATDAAGNSSTAETTFTLDTILPVIRIDSPVAGTTNIPAQLLVYSMNEGTAVVTVDGLEVNTSSGSLLNALPEGVHTVRVEAVDSAGNRGSSEVTFTIDMTAPVVTISSPQAGTGNNNHPLLNFTTSDGSVVVKVDGIIVSKISGDLLDALSDGPHAITVEAIDVAGNRGYAEVSITIDTAVPAVSLTSPAEGLVKTNTPALAFTVNEGVVTVLIDGVPVSKVSGDSLDLLAEGPHVVRVEAVDAAGNRGSAQVNITVDTVAPTVAVTSPAAGLTNNRTPLLAYTVSDGTVVVKVDGNVVNKVSGSTLDILADGPHTIRVEATDAAGNMGFSEVNFSVDTAVPTVGITSPAGGITNNRTPLLTYAVSDGTVVVKVDGNVVNKVSGNTLDALADGPHTLWVEATDGAGNAGSATVTFTVDTVTTVTINPVTTPTSSTSQTIRGSREEGAVITARVNTSARIGSISYPTSTTWSFVISNLVKGTNTITVTAKDNATNTASATASIVRK
ncbi:MAG: Ig-like domain-containing protein, partial [Nitrospiraceae bacterium]|nr:Ig-like domain-containing protein [Nitrospiraceae bacterium]